MLCFSGTKRDRRVVVNADDFGMSAVVNRAIILAFDRRLISSTTIMANMPGFEEACELVHQYGLEHRVGLHLNVTSGRPLTAEIALCRTFCDDNGYWLRPRRIFTLGKREGELLEAEIAAQVLACEQRGITPTHWDSHHHMHGELAISPIVIRMAKRLGVPRIRLAFNCGPRRPNTSAVYRMVARAYQHFMTIRLQFHGLAGTDYFGSVRDTREILLTTTADVEVMVHPTLSERGDLVDLDGQDLESKIAALGISPTEMCSYTSL